MSMPQGRVAGMAGNRTGIAAMLASMACFTANDTCIKLASGSLPLGEIIFLRNGFAALVVLAVGLFQGSLSLPGNAPARLLSWRLVGEVLATLLFLAALVRMAIADAIAIGQFTPLVITAAGAVFLGERVGWRRWLAALVGLAGVLLIIRPGTSAFSWPALLALASLPFVVLRDLVTRQIVGTVSTSVLTLMSAVAVMASGLLLAPFETWVWPDARSLALMVTAGVFLSLGYALIIVAMRSGEIAVVSPFRYSVILSALLAGILVWGELPDALSQLGIVIVTLAGLYTLYRERAVQVRDAAGGA